jgi:probable HAF family extracellular repeat protein
MTELLDIPTGADDSAANAMTADGLMAAGRGRSSSSGYEACQWNHGNPNAVPLGDLAGGLTNSQVYGVSSNGEFLVGFGTSATSIQVPGRGEACYWIAGNIHAIGDLPGGGPAESYAWDVSDDGRIIVGEGTTALGREAFVWTPGASIRNLHEVLTDSYGLDLTGWILRGARGLSSDGRSIVGFGANPQGQTEAWLARLPCAADVSPLAGNGAIDVDDLIAVILQWGPCAGCRADVDQNGVVDVDDLIAVILAWGPCQ